MIKEFCLFFTLNELKLVIKAASFLIHELLTLGIENWIPYPNTTWLKRGKLYYCEVEFLSLFLLKVSGFLGMILYLTRSPLSCQRYFGIVIKYNILVYINTYGSNRIYKYIFSFILYLLLGFWFNNGFHSIKNTQLIWYHHTREKLLYLFIEFLIAERYFQ